VKIMQEANLNYYLYLTARSALNHARRLVPSSLIRPSRSLDQEFTIGITTYIEPYEGYFKPLYQAISRSFPEVHLCIAVNGHGHAEAQRHSLERIQQGLCSKAPHHRFVLHDRAVGLTTSWNEILDQSLPLPVLMLNDDLRIRAWLRRWAEGFDWQGNPLTLLNSTWSNFVITDRTIDRLGGFDPGLPGIGFEVMDYTARAGLTGESISNVFCPHITHRHRQPKATSFALVSDMVRGKYTSANQAYFFGKWQTCPADEGVFIKQIAAHVKPVRPLKPVLCCGLFRRAPAERSPSTRIGPELPMPQISA
jgi:hypothetical protein